MSSPQRYLLRNPASGREVVLEAQPDEVYRDRETDEPLEVRGKLLPLAPSASRLPWAVENLRFCPWCHELAQLDLNADWVILSAWSCFDATRPSES